MSDKEAKVWECPYCGQHTRDLLDSFIEIGHNCPKKRNKWVLWEVKEK